MSSLTVTPLNGEPFRCVVHSETNAKEAYIVDLQEHFPLGSCACRDWACRRYPDFKRTGKAYGCKHILRCKDFVLNRIIEEFIKNEPKDVNYD